MDPPTLLIIDIPTCFIDGKFRIHHDQAWRIREKYRIGSRIWRQHPGELVNGDDPLPLRQAS
jgi:hypothetical protein